MATADASAAGSSGMSSSLPMVSQLVARLISPDTCNAWVASYEHADLMQEQCMLMLAFIMCNKYSRIKTQGKVGTPARPGR